MQYTDCNGKHHLNRESRNLRIREPSVDAESFQPGRCPGSLQDAHSEECAEENSHNEGHSAEEGDESVHLAEARILHLQSEHERNQHKEYSVAGVSHTHREEEHKERTEYRGRVELVVGRHTIHSGEHLEVLCKPVVLQLNRRIVLFGCRLVAVVDVHRVKAGAEPLIVRCRSEAGENGEVVVNCLFCGRLCKIEVET